MAKSAFFEKLLNKIEKLDHRNVENYLLKLAQEKGLLESIFNSMLEGIVVTDREQKVIFINQSAQDYLGASDRELFHQSLPEYLKSLELDELAHLMISDWGKLIHRDIQIIHPQPRSLHLNVFPLVSAENQYLGLVLILSDVTKKKEDEMEHLRSEKLQTISLMAACVAHEIGNPLNAIDLNLQLLERDLRKSSSSSVKNLLNSVKVIKEEIRRLDHTVRSILAASRPIKPNLHGSDLIKIIEETLKIMTEELSRNKITIKKSLDVKVPKVMLDEFQIKQALSNIIKNAMEAMPHGGILNVKIFKNEDCVIVAVEDNGEGISKEVLQKIFEPYFTTKITGSGLGLMIAYRIVKDHGGKIEIESKHGEGTAVTIRLPIGIKRKMKLLPEKNEEA